MKPFSLFMKLLKILKLSIAKESLHCFGVSTFFLLLVKWNICQGHLSWAKLFPFFAQNSSLRLPCIFIFFVKLTKQYWNWNLVQDLLDFIITFIIFKLIKFYHKLLLWLSKERNCGLFNCATFRLSHSNVHLKNSHRKKEDILRWTAKKRKKCLDGEWSECTYRKSQ